MNTLDYSLLVKDGAVRARIARLQRTKAVLFFVTLLASFLPMLNRFFENSVFVSVLVAFVLLFFAAVLVFNLWFYFFVDRQRKAQILSADDEVDKVFIWLNDAYTAHFASVRRIILVAIAVSAACLFAAIGLAIVAASLDMSNLAYVAFVACIGFVVTVVVSAILVSTKQTGFARRHMQQIEWIRGYTMMQDGLSHQQIASKKRSIILNAADNQKVLAYLYPDEGIRARVQKLSIFMVISIFIVSFIGATGLMFSLSRENWIALGIFLGVWLAGFATVIILFVIKSKRLIKAQRTIFEADPNRYKYHIELADRTKKYQKKSNIVTLITSIALVALAIALVLIVPDSGMEIAVLILLCLFAWVVVVLAIFIPSYIHYRKQAKQIEQKIEQHLLQQNQENIDV